MRRFPRDVRQAARIGAVDFCQSLDGEIPGLRSIAHQRADCRLVDTYPQWDWYRLGAQYVPQVPAPGLCNRAANSNVPHVVAVGGECRPEVFEVLHVVEFCFFTFDLEFFLQFFFLQFSRFPVGNCTDEVLRGRCELTPCLMDFGAAAVFAQQVTVLASSLFMPVVILVVSLEVVRDEAGKNIFPWLPLVMLLAVTAPSD